MILWYPSVFSFVLLVIAMKRLGVLLVLWSVAFWFGGWGQATPPVSYDPLAAAHDKMVDEEIVAAGIKNPRVIAAMRATPRHEFVQATERPLAYYDMALPIGNSQTISPPYVVAYMTEQLDPQPDDKVLEIGTGSGFQAAVLSPLVKDVYTIEIVKPLGERAARTLKRLKYANVHTKIGDGFAGWAEHAPFDKIIVTCSPEKVPDGTRGRAKRRRPPDRSGRRALSADAVLVQEGGRQTRLDGVAADAICANDRLGRGRPRNQAGPGQPARRQRQFRRARHQSATQEIVPEPQAVLPSKPADDEAPKPVGWHYQRQLELVEAKDAPDGQHYVRFANSDPGGPAAPCREWRSTAAKFTRLEFPYGFARHRRPRRPQRGRGAGFGSDLLRRKPGQVGHAWLGPWKGTFGWRRESEVIAVPPLAREAVLRIGLHGGVGEVSFDDIQVKPARHR